MPDLTQQKCVPCESDIPPMTEDEIGEMQQDIPEWTVVEEDGIPRLKREFTFRNFAESLAFTNKIGQLAEDEGHHPLIALTWGQVTVQWWTHNIEGLHKNDFIMAAKTSAAYNK